MNQRYWSSRIQGLVPYTPGEQPKDRTFIKLNTNENPYPPSPRVLEAIRREADQRLRLYPDPESAALRGALAEHYGVEPEQVFCGNGSDEVLGLCFYALFSPGRKVVFPDITYSFYPVYTELFGLDYEEIPLNEDFTLPVERFLGGDGGAVICNPNAPTGRALPLSDIRRIVEANPAAAVLVDEAYADFGAQSAVELIDQYPNLLVVRTMSKSRSLAGMRIGYALGSQDLIAGVNCVKNSFNSYPLDRLAQAAGEAAVRDTAYFEETRGKIMAPGRGSPTGCGRWASRSMTPAPISCSSPTRTTPGGCSSRGCGTGACWCAGLNAPGYRTICGCPSGQTRRWRPCAGLWKRF